MMSVKEMHTSLKKTKKHCLILGCGWAPRLWGVAKIWPEKLANPPDTQVADFPFFY